MFVVSSHNGSTCYTWLEILPQVTRTDRENTANGERLLESKTVNLRIWEKEDLKLVTEWINNLDFWGKSNPFHQMSKTDMQKAYDMPSEERWFLIEKKDGSKVGNIGHRPVGTAQEIVFAVLPSERKKGYCSEAVMIMVDYLFLSKDIVRVQAHTDVRNENSQKVLEKIGFKKEGIVRNAAFFAGKMERRFSL
jgi:RimJ/RimL family protein N-acetyltransferase